MLNGRELPTLPLLSGKEIKRKADTATEAFYQRQFLAFLKKRLLNIRTLSLGYQLLFAIVVAQLVITGILLAFADQLMPRITSSATSSQTATIALPIYLFVVGSYLLGWTFALIAAFRMPLIARLTTLLFSVFLLGYVPTKQIFADSGRAGSPYGSELLLRYAQVFLLLLIAGWGMSRAIGQWRIVAKDEHRWQNTLASAIMVLFVLSYFLLDIAIARVYAQNAGANQAPSSSIGIQLQFLPFLFIIIVYWGSTDFIEWGETIAQQVGIVVHHFRVHRVLYILLAGIAVANLLDLHRFLAWGDLLPAAATSLCLFALIAVVAWSAQIDIHWPEQVPPITLFAGLGFLIGFAEIIAGIANPATNNKLYTTLSVGASLILLTISIGLIIQGRRRHNSAIRASGLFLAMMAALLIALSVPQVANVLGLPVIPATQATVPAFRFLISIGTLVVLFGLAVTHKLTRTLIAPMSYVLVLFAGVQVISIFLLFIIPNLQRISTDSAIITVLFFLVALFWDLLTSGEQVTNKDSLLFPRKTRILFYFGYTLISAATLLFLKSQRVDMTATPLSAEDSYKTVGAIGLGLPLIGYLFIRNLGVWHYVVQTASRQQENERAQAHTPADSPALVTHKGEA